MTDQERYLDVEMKFWDDCSPAERVERWQNVERVMVKMTPHERKKHFNMLFWGEKNDCGTVGCVAGMCALDQWFQKRGFSARWRPGTDKFGNPREYMWWPWRATPQDFFGHEGNARIFTNDLFTEHKGARIHKTVLAEVRRYIKELKVEAAEVTT